MQQETLSVESVATQTALTDQTAPETGAAEESEERDAMTDTAAPLSDTNPSAVGGNADGAPNGVRVRFNHTERQLSEQEAIAYAQKGMKWESFQQDYDRLRFLAEGAGKTVSELIAHLMEQDREAELQAVLDKCGDRETAQQLVDLRRDRRQARFQTEQQTQEIEARQRQNERLADGYLALKQAIPAAPSFNELPEEVIRTAVQQDISLYDAYLRFTYAQQQQTAAEQTKRERAAAASTGSLAGSVDQNDGESQAFLSAFERVFS